MLGPAAPATTISAAPKIASGDVEFKTHDVADAPTPIAIAPDVAATQPSPIAIALG